MVWYYYNCIYGPGHQSETDGFREMPDDMSEKEVAEEIIEDFADYEWPIIKVWQVDKVPAGYLNEKIQTIKNSIKYQQEKLKRLKNTIGVETFSEPGEDTEIKEALRRTVSSSLMEQLHKRGIIIGKDTVQDWRGYYSTPPTLKPLKKYKKKVLDAIKACKKYPKY